MQQHPVSLEVRLDSEGRVVVTIPASLVELWALHPGDRLRIDPTAVEKVVAPPPGDPDRKRYRRMINDRCILYHYFPLSGRTGVSRDDMFPPDRQPFGVSDGKREFKNMWVASSKITSMGGIYSDLDVKPGDYLEIREIDRWKNYTIRKV
jgi:hypothetical protein